MSQNISDTRIELRGGDDNLSIDASASSSNDWRWWDSSAYAVGVDNSSIDLGSGGDRLFVSASATGAQNNAWASQQLNRYRLWR